MFYNTTDKENSIIIEDQGRIYTDKTNFLNLNSEDANMKNKKQTIFFLACFSTQLKAVNFLNVGDLHRSVNPRARCTIHMSDRVIINQAPIIGFCIASVKVPYYSFIKIEWS